MNLSMDLLNGNMEKEESEHIQRSSIEEMGLSTMEVNRTVSLLADFLPQDIGEMGILDGKEGKTIS